MSRAPLLYEFCLHEPRGLIEGSIFAPSNSPLCMEAVVSMATWRLQTLNPKSLSPQPLHAEKGVYALTKAEKRHIGFH
eukprot:1149306-Pelagomonas_calceolata.AAC.2